MRSREDIAAYIDRSGLPFREVDESTWILRSSSAGQENIVVQTADPLLLFRVKVMELESKQDSSALFRKLLELNASDMVHCSYGIADGAVVVSGALLMASADYDEFQGSLDEVTLTLANHYETLAPYRKGSVRG